MFTLDFNKIYVFMLPGRSTEVTEVATEAATVAATEETAVAVA